MQHTEVYLKNDPQWYKDAIIYEIHIRAFYDSNADGIGDFHGALEKLDYLADLGVTALWILPFYPSPLKDDGYDITDYFCINPDYGDLRTFRRFLREAHKRGLRVITELVLNQPPISIHGSKGPGGPSQAPSGGTFTYAVPLLTSTKRPG